jgi:hypothetical protein
VDKLQPYLRHCADDTDRIEHAVGLLSGNAYKWHTVHGRTIVGFQPWCKALLEYGTDPRKHENAVAKLRVCKQNSRKVQRYNSEFTTICLDLDAARGWTEGSLLDLYLEGLDSQVRSHVEARGKPANLADAQIAANIAAGESFTAHGNSKPGSIPQHHKQARFQQQHQQQQQGPKPMEIGNVKLQEKKTWPPPHPPTKPCPICGKGLHWGVQCPTVKAAQSN